LFIINYQLFIDNLHPLRSTYLILQYDYLLIIILIIYSSNIINFVEQEKTPH